MKVKAKGDVSKSKELYFDDLRVGDMFVFRRDFPSLMVLVKISKRKYVCIADEDPDPAGSLVGSMYNVRSEGEEEEILTNVEITNFVYRFIEGENDEALQIHRQKQSNSRRVPVGKWV